MIHRCPPLLQWILIFIFTSTEAIDQGRSQKKIRDFQFGFSPIDIEHIFMRFRLLITAIESIWEGYLYVFEVIITAQYNHFIILD